MQKDLRIVIIGAGMAGILAAIKLLENNYKNFTLYEKLIKLVALGEIIHTLD